MTAPAPRAKILVVEDDPALRHLYQNWLFGAGFAVAAVGDGIDALRHIDAETTDLIVLDLTLPRFGGIEVAHEIAATTGRRIPVVIVTGEAHEIAEGPALCVLRKPVDSDQLIDTVRRCLSHANGVAFRERRKRAMAGDRTRALAANRGPRRRRKAARR